MKKNRLALVVLVLVAGGLAVAKAQSFSSNGNLDAQSSDLQQKKIIYFNPEVFPNVEEIKDATNTAFFSAVSDKILSLPKNAMLRADAPVEFDNIDVESIKEYCKNNNADFAVVPKVQYFKVGLGKYVFSNQVVVSMKLYDADGKFITETNYDTYKKNMRLLGSAENSVKVGTKGAITEIIKNLKKIRRSKVDQF